MKPTLLVLLTFSSLGRALAAAPDDCDPRTTAPLNAEQIATVSSMLQLGDAYRTTCMTSLTCMDWIKFSQIQSQLDAAAKAGPVTPKQFGEITDRNLAGADLATFKRVGRALLARSLSASKVSPHDAGVIAMAIGANSDLKAELTAYTEKAKAFGTYLNDFQKTNDDSYATRLGRFFEYGTAALVDQHTGSDLTGSTGLGSQAAEYGAAASALMTKVRSYLDSQPKLSGEEKTTMLTAFQAQVKQVNDALAARVSDAGDSLQTAAVPLDVAAGALGAGGLITAFVASLPEAAVARVGLGGLSRIGAKGAVAGGALTAFTTESRRLFQAWASSDGSQSALCTLADSYTNLSSADEVKQVGGGATLGAVMSVGTMALIARGGVGTSIAAAGTVAPLFWGGSDKGVTEPAAVTQLKTVLANATTSDERECINKAIALARTMDNFDAASFLAMTFGPQALEHLLPKAPAASGTAATKAAAVPHDAPSATRVPATSAHEPPPSPPPTGREGPPAVNAPPPEAHEPSPAAKKPPPEGHEPPPAAPAKPSPTEGLPEPHGPVVPPLQGAEAEALALRLTSSEVPPKAKLPTARARELIGRYGEALQQWMPFLSNPAEHPYLLALLDKIDLKLAGAGQARDAVVEEINRRMREAVCSCDKCTAAVNEELFGRSWADKIAATGLPKCRLAAH